MGVWIHSTAVDALFCLAWIYAISLAADYNNLGLTPPTDNVRAHLELFHNKPATLFLK